jgi:hypothetical protein
MESKKFSTIFGWGHAFLFGIFITLYVKQAWISTIISLFLLTAFHAVAFFYAPNTQQKYVLVVYLGLIATNITIFSQIYSHFGIVDSSTGKLYFGGEETLYLSIVTWTTLGYGDFRPSVESRFYAAAQAVLGYVYMGLFIGYLIHYLNRQNSNIQRNK